MPTTSPQRRRQRFAIAALLACLLVTLSGCVYLRLLRFKNQLRDFDEHVAVVKEDRLLALTFSDPVLEDGDFEFITESKPTSIEQVSTEPLGENWLWRFRKEQASEEDRPFSVVFVTRFDDHLLTRIDFDPHLIQVIPPDFVLALFRSMGKAKINKLRRSATAAMSREDLEGVNLPSLREIEQVMGEPTLIDEKQSKLAWVYVFNFHNPDNDELSGQFKITFKGETDDLDSEILGFDVTGKAR